jgi:REP element-mobilizing transposase RayT
MMRVLAYHVVFSMYGFWLPNDPRGSWSDFVWSWELLRFGKATKTDSRRSVAHVAHDRQARERAKSALRYPAVQLSGRQALAVGHGFRQAVPEGGYAVHACSILPEHVHMVIGRHERPLGRLVGHLKARATQRLAAEGLWPDPGRPVWGGPGWRVFLYDRARVQEAIAYVEKNAEKEGKPRQRWPFVVPFVPEASAE